ncbi:hypothetical protein ACWEQJ_10005 [Streptomyces cyaneofuscatus]
MTESLLVGFFSGWDSRGTYALAAVRTPAHRATVREAAAQLWVGAPPPHPRS